MISMADLGTGYLESELPNYADEVVVNILPPPYYPILLDKEFQGQTDYWVLSTYDPSELP